MAPVLLRRDNCGARIEFSRLLLSQVAELQAETGETAAADTVSHVYILGIGRCVFVAMSVCREIEKKITQIDIYDILYVCM